MYSAKAVARRVGLSVMFRLPRPWPGDWAEAKVEVVRGHACFSDQSKNLRRMIPHQIKLSSGSLGCVAWLATAQSSSGRPGGQE